jgi:hypothetical protein
VQLHQVGQGPVSGHKAQAGVHAVNVSKKGAQARILSITYRLQLMQDTKGDCMIQARRMDQQMPQSIGGYGIAVAVVHRLPNGVRNFFGDPTLSQLLDNLQQHTSSHSHDQWDSVLKHPRHIKDRSSHVPVATRRSGRRRCPWMSHPQPQPPPPVQGQPPDHQQGHAARPLTTTREREYSDQGLHVTLSVA